MIALLQRVSQASVTVEQEVVGEIKQGLLVLLAIEPEDNLEKVEKMADKVSKYRIFEDENGKMNLNVGQISGDILVVSQFTLAADTSRGLRPSFSNAAAPDFSKNMYKQFCLKLREKGFMVPTGIFGADMKVSLINDGPVTIPLSL